MYLDVVNLDKYDVILGTPFLTKNKVILDFSTRCVKFGATTLPAFTAGEDLDIQKKRGNKKFPIRRVPVNTGTASNQE